MVRKEKTKAVEEIIKLIDIYNVVGILDMNKLPSRQLQDIRKKLRGNIVIKTTKKTILTRAIKNSKRVGIQQLEQLIPKQPSIVFTDLNPFKFYSNVIKLKSPATARKGDIAPTNIIVSAGPTSLLPGPVISEFTKAGIPAGIENGKIAIKKDTLVAKAGSVISGPLASALKKLGIEPILVGLNVVAVYENGIIYKKDTLELIDIFPKMLASAHQNAFNLSIFISYPTKENIMPLLAKAFNAAKTLENKIGGVN
jgi:large subunit ribosomal protein L10